LERARLERLAAHVEPVAELGLDERGQRFLVEQPRREHLEAVCRHRVAEFTQNAPRVLSGRDSSLLLKAPVPHAQERRDAVPSWRRRRNGGAAALAAVAPLSDAASADARGRPASDRRRAQGTAARPPTLQR